MKRWLSLALLPAMLAVPDPANAQATAGQAFAWFGELVTFDDAAKIVTARAPIQEHVARYVEKFQPGDDIFLFWSQYEAEGDVIHYVEFADATVAESGYIVPAQFVASDPVDHTLTFSTNVSDTASGTLSSASPGTPIKVGAPMIQSPRDLSLTTVALNETPRPRPAPVEEVETWEGISVVGEWALETDLMGNEVNLSCSFTQQGPELGGTCTGPPPLGEVGLEGNVDGSDVTFKIEADVGMKLVLLHTGTVNDEGTTIEGTLDLMGNVAPFTMVRSQELAR